MNIQIQILNPEVKAILDQLVKLNLIKITTEEEVILFSNLLNRIRGNSNDELSLEEITKEVESTRQKRFNGGQKSD